MTVRTDVNGSVSCPHSALPSPLVSLSILSRQTETRPLPVRGALLHTSSPNFTVMAADLSSPAYGQWVLDKPAVEAQDRSSVQSFEDAEDKMQIAPTMNEIRSALEEKKTTVMLDQRYLSSEEALSPLEPDMELSDPEVFTEQENYNRESDDEILEAFRHSILDLATVVIIRSVGPPKLIDVPSSPKSSFSEASSRKQPNSDDIGKEPVSMSRDSMISSATSSSGEKSPFQQPTSYFKYSLDFSDSEVSSPGWNSNIIPTSTIHPPSKAAFLSTDPFATGHEPTIITVTRPITPNIPTPTVKPRHERFKSFSGKITTLKKRSKGLQLELGTNPERRLSSSSSYSAQSPRKIPKLEARGADEREATIEIPPCPYDTDDEHMSPVSPMSFSRRPTLLRRRGILMASA
jgi:hypothetical protein